MGHMWELYAFWGWVGPAMVAAATAAGSGGSLSDRIGRSKAAGLCLMASGLASLLFGWFIGGSLLPIILLGLWYGFWAVADTATYKAGLTDMVSTRIRGTSLGFQSALGFGITVISPQIFGAVLDATNKGNQNITVWGPAFAVLAAGPIIGLILLVVLRKHPKAILMAEWRK